jgi:hypothetical protein
MKVPLKHLPWEALVWMTGLLGLAFYSPEDSEHIVLCPVSRLGFTFCPGCGLGRSIAHFFHGNIPESLSTHPLGIFAVIILSYRIIALTKQYYNIWLR